MEKIDFGKQIKQVRLKYKLTQQQFGEIIGKTAPTVQGYETNRITPPFDVLMTISSLFHISIGDLMGLKSSTVDNISELFNLYIEAVGDLNE